MNKITTIIELCVLMLSLLLSGCHKVPTDSAGPPTEFIDVSDFSIQTYPKVDGSTSAWPLQRVIACKILKIDYHWLDPFFYEFAMVYPVEKDSASIPVAQFIRDIRHSGTHNAYVNLITDSVDIVLVAREPSADELHLADSLGIVMAWRGVALDALVFILNKENPLVNLSERQIQDIYTGAITNWQELGAPSAAINPYQRERNSGSQELMEKLVMRGLPTLEAPQMVIFGMMGIINRLSSDPFGIGYTVYYFGQFMASKSNLKYCRVNGIEPNQITIGAGSYLYTTEVYAVIRSTLDRNSTAYRLWQWLVTTEGQKAVAESRYIPKSN